MVFMPVFNSDNSASRPMLDRAVERVTPRPLMFQLDLLRSVGFNKVELLHKHSCFAAFGAIK